MLLFIFRKTESIKTDLPITSIDAINAVSDYIDAIFFVFILFFPQTIIKTTYKDTNSMG